MDIRPLTERNDKNLTSVFGLHWFGSRFIEPVLQSEAHECGLACLCMIAQRHGLDIDIHHLRQRCENSSRGITLAQLMSLRLAKLKDDGELKHFHVSMAKRNNVAMALNAARVLRDVLGANGITLEYNVGRHMCNLETVYTYEGTHDIHTLSIGEHLTGHPAYR